MADEKAPEVPDPTEKPNFKALREWIDRLESWVDAALKAQEELQERYDKSCDDRLALDEKLSEAEGAQKELDDLEVELADVGRGIRTLDEVLQGR